MFNLATGTWTRLQPRKKGRNGSSSVVYNDQFVVLGGWKKRSIEKVSLNAAHPDRTILWENVPAEFPGGLSGHCSVVYNGRLIVTGGYDDDKGATSYGITEISLVPPFTRKLLTTMPQARQRHGVAMFNDKIAILVGQENIFNELAFSSVVMYDITKKNVTS